MSGFDLHTFFSKKTRKIHVQLFKNRIFERLNFGRIFITHKLFLHDYFGTYNSGQGLIGSELGPFGAFEPKIVVKLLTTALLGLHMFYLYHNSEPRYFKIHLPY